MVRRGTGGAYTCYFIEKGRIIPIYLSFMKLRGINFEHKFAYTSLDSGSEGGHRYGCKMIL